MRRAFARIFIAYATALAVALAVGRAVSSDDPLWIAFFADLAATAVVFAFSLGFRNSSFYDAYWSVAPPAIGVYWIASSRTIAVDETRQLVALGLVSLWAARLTWNWARGWGGLSHQDWRYDRLREQTGGAYWLVSFAGIHMAPTLWVFLGCLPLYPALAVGIRPWNALDALAALVTLAAIWCEARADKQLVRFRRSNPPPGSILGTGLWAWSRHPNYLGEMGFWWGLFLFGLAADPSWWWTGVGALGITLMFRFVSLPMIETRMRERRPDWDAHAARTSLVLPRPPRA